MRDASYVVLDTETTGLRAGRHGLTELYAARTDGFGKVKKEFHSLINPGQCIPRFITKLTGITGAMVEDAPPAQEVIKKFTRFVQDDDVLVGHNLRFDLSFLDYERRKALRRPFATEGLCTLLLSRRVFSPHPLPSYKLGVVANHFGISADGAHRAKKDVQMTIAVQQELFNALELSGVQKRMDVLHLQRLPLAKALRLLE